MICEPKEMKGKYKTRAGYQNIKDYRNQCTLFLFCTFVFVYFVDVVLFLLLLVYLLCVNE